MKFHLVIKYHADLSNKDLIERICNIAEKNHQITCCHRDLENWGQKTFTINELMDKAFELIDNCDALIVEFTEGGFGVAIETGYAKAKNIPIYVLTSKGKDLLSISTPMKGTCNESFEYETDDDIQNIFNHITQLK
jgi:nucleoside 2-deoxyribosyltransferase